jgi:hypothetical protein
LGPLAIEIITHVNSVIKNVNIRFTKKCSEFGNESQNYHFCQKNIL